MKQFIRNSALALTPYLLAAILCSFIFGSFFIFLLLAISAFIVTQLVQSYYFQKWCVDQSASIPSVGLNRLWKNIYLLLETRLNDKRDAPEIDIDALQDITQGDYGIVLLKAAQIVWLNKQAAVLLKLDADRDIGTNIGHSLRAPNFLDALSEKHYGQGIILEDWQPPIAVCLLPYGAEHLCMLVQDFSRVTEIKRTNQELIGNVAHELRSPLTVIYGYLEILKDIGEKAKDEDSKKILDNMQTQVSRMKLLADNALNIAYLENNELTEQQQSWVDVSAMLKSILEPLNNNQQCQIDSQIEAFQLYGNATELHSVFYNLIDNAICHSQSKKIKVVWRKNQQGAYFEVIDEGIGIEARHLPKLSKRFYRVDQARSREEGNAGLGLSIVKHVLDRHQATLEIESEAGKGSTFRCCFPLTRIN